MPQLRFMLRFVGVVQLFFGALFTCWPTGAATIFGLSPAAPDWANWLLIMLGARFLGYGIGTLAAAREPAANLSWINTMIAVQVIDWLATLGYLIAGSVTLRNVGPAAVLPVVFVTGLVYWHPRRLAPALGV